MSIDKPDKSLIYSERHGHKITVEIKMISHFE